MTTRSVCPAAGATPFRLVVLAGAVAALIGCAPMPAPSVAPLTAQQLASQITVSVIAGPPSLLATGAFADLGPNEGVRLVTVRIVDRLPVSIRLESSVNLTFAEVPRLCLVGPDAAPDDAGLEDRCWGSPDVTTVAGERLPRSADGQPMLRAGQPVEVHLTVERGDERCDYPPGDWTLDLDGRPLVNGEPPAQSVYAPPAQFSVAILPNEAALPYLKTDATRYCGLATLVYREQGEPATVGP